MPLPPGRARAFEAAGKQGCACVAWSRKRRSGFISRQGVYESPRPSSYAPTCGQSVPKSGIGRGTGAFIYVLSADETRPALAAPRHASTALFSCRFKSCRFKCPCPPRRQRHFHDNADRAYNTLHFASQSRVPNGGVAPFGNPHKKRRYAPPLHGAHTAFSCYPALRLYRLSKSQRGIDVVSLSK